MEPASPTHALLHHGLASLVCNARVDPSSSLALPACLLAPSITSPRRH